MHTQLVQTHSQTPMCLPKLLIYIHSGRKRPQKNKPGSTEPATPMATSQRHMDRHRNTIQESICKDPHPVSKIDNPQSHNAHKDTQRATQTGLDAHTDTKSQPPALTPPSPPKRQQVLALTLGTVKTQTALSFQQPEPTLGPASNTASK